MRGSSVSEYRDDIAWIKARRERDDCMASLSDALYAEDARLRDLGDDSSAFAKSRYESARILAAQALNALTYTFVAEQREYIKWKGGRLCLADGCIAEADSGQQYCEMHATALLELI